MFSPFGIFSLFFQLIQENLLDVGGLSTLFIRAIIREGRIDQPSISRQIVGTTKTGYDYGNRAR